VTADILPPPLYLIELRLVLSEAVEGSMPLATAQAEAARLEKEYGERVAYWTQNPPYGLQAHLLGRQHEAGTRFISASHAVVAAIARGDAAGAQAALTTANVAYLDHREAVAQMDHATQSNAALVQQSAAAADSLKTQAQQLVRAVTVFKLRAAA
jgi:methyl-accepting chemotaxis protein